MIQQKNAEKLSKLSFAGKGIEKFQFGQSERQNDSKTIPPQATQPQDGSLSEDRNRGVLRTHLNATLYVIPINATLSAIAHIHYQCVVVTGFGTSQHMMFLTY